MNWIHQKLSAILELRLSMFLQNFGSSFEVFSKPRIPVTSELTTHLLSRDYNVATKVVKLFKWSWFTFLILKSEKWTLYILNSSIVISFKKICCSSIGLNFGVKRARFGRSTRYRGLYSATSVARDEILFIYVVPWKTQIQADDNETVLLNDAMQR